VMSLTENTIGIWFVDVPDGDWLATVNAVEPEGYELVYRTRNRVDDKIFDSEDTKDWGGGRISGKLSKEEVIEKMRELVADVKLYDENSKSHELLMGDKTFVEFMDEFMELPFVNARKMSKDEAKEHGYLDEVIH